MTTSREIEAKNRESLIVFNEPYCYVLSKSLSHDFAMHYFTKEKPK